MNVCPDCGCITDTLRLEFIYADGIVRVDGREAKLAPQQMQFLDSLVDRYPTPALLSDLYDDVYRGVPEHALPAPDGLKQTIYDIRKRFEKARVNLDIISIKTAEGPKWLLSHRIASADTSSEKAA